MFDGMSPLSVIWWIEKDLQISISSPSLCASIYEYDWVPPLQMKHDGASTDLFKVEIFFKNLCGYWRGQLHLTSSKCMTAKAVVDAYVGLVHPSKSSSFWPSFWRQGTMFSHNN
jgi:hypothetical protein